MKQYEKLLAEIERRKKVLTVLGEGCIVGQRNAAEYKLLCELEEFAKGLTSEVTSEVTSQISEDFKQFEEAYLEKEKDEILCVYDRHAGLVDGVNWQKQQMTKDAMDGEICEDSCGCLYAHIPMPCLKGFSRLDKIKALIIKED